MIALAGWNRRGYDDRAAENSVAGFSSSNLERRTAPDRRFFMPGRTISMADCVGRSKDLPVSFQAGLLTLLSSPPSFSSEFGGFPNLERKTAMSNIIIFSFGSHEIRVTDQDGNPWFVLRDLLAGMASKTTTTRAVESIKQGLGYGVVSDITLQTAGGTQQVIIIAESASTYLLSRSSTDKGRELNRFIHDEVLSAIRKAGSHWLEQLSSSTRPSISTQPPQKVAGVAKNAGFYSLNLALTREKIEESHSTNSSNADMNMGISPSPAAKTKLQYPAFFATPAQLFLATHIFNIWYGTIGEGAYTASEVIERTAANPYMTAALLEVAHNREDWERVCPIRLGRWLRKHENWTDGLLRVAPPKYNTNRKVRLWSVQQVSA